MRLNHPTSADPEEIFIGNFIAQKKEDGVRCVVFTDSKETAFYSKNLIRIYPEIGLPDYLPPHSVVDCELLSASDDSWESSLSAATGATRGRLVAFDILEYRGEKLDFLPLSERLERLQDFCSYAPETVPLGSAISGPVDVMRENAFKYGWEGIVVKDLDGDYLSPWYKVKPVRTLVVRAMRGHYFVFRSDGSPHCVSRCENGVDGDVVIQIEGVTIHNKARAARFLRKAYETEVPVYSQLEKHREA